MTSIYVRQPIFNRLKQNIYDNNGNTVLNIKVKLRVNPIYYFYINKELIFTAKLTMVKNSIKKQFIIYDKQDKKQAIVRPKPIHKKENVFSEFVIESNDEVFDVKSSFAFKEFTITDKEKEKVVEAKRVSSFMKNIMEIRDYKIDIINDSYMKTFLWIAITKGIIELM